MEDLNFMTQLGFNIGYRMKEIFALLILITMIIGNICLIISFANKGFIETIKILLQK